MSNIILPDLPGLGWDVKIKEEFGNLIQPSAAPGFSSRVNLGPDPIFHIELTYEVLREFAPGATSNVAAKVFTRNSEINMLRGFWRAMKGNFDSFLLYMPYLTRNSADGIVTGQVLTPDAFNVAPFVIGGSSYNSEAIYEVAGINSIPGTPPVIKKNGTPLVGGTDYVIQGGYSTPAAVYGGLVAVFSTSTSGAIITADFTWYYRVRFEESTEEFDKFMMLLWHAQQIKLVTTRT